VSVSARAIAASLLLGVAPLSAQSDTGQMRSLFTWRDAVLAGGFVLGTIAIRPFDKRLTNVLQDSMRQSSKLYHASAAGFRTIAIPGAFIIGGTMYAAGRLSHSERLAELGLFGTEALLIGEGAAGVMKSTFGRARPFVDTVPNPDNWQIFRGFSAGDKYRSFPSGHTVAAFAAAAAVSAETSRWWPSSVYFIGPTMYGGATLVGLSRMYENRHWASDVIMGAAIGTFAGTKVVRYHLTHPGNRLDRWLLNASVSPSDLGHLTLSIIPAPR
jgi:membrane-associated phospholipid phosphatase